jgi:putative sterol carrier protein
MSVGRLIHLRKLTSREGEPIEDILHRGLEHLGDLEAKATVQFRFTDTQSTHTVLFTDSGGRVHPRNVTNPTLVVITTANTFYRITDGSYSPLQAYADNKLKVLGNVELARQIIKILSDGTGNQANICLLLEDSWTIDDEFGNGSLTLTGELFSPEGNVELVYDWGGGFYQRDVTADSSGTFTLTESDLACGIIPGQSYGVKVTATDIATGKYTTKTFSTPC